MELALLVYVISILPKIEQTTSTLIIIGVVALSIIAFIICLDTTNVDDWWKETKPFVKRIAPALLLLGFINIMVPSEKTAYTMVGAYAAQAIAVNPKTAEVGSKVMTIINQKLDIYIKEGASDLTKKLNPAN